MSTARRSRRSLAPSALPEPAVPVGPADEREDGADAAARFLVKELYEAVLRRTPAEVELAYWVGEAKRQADRPGNIVRRFRESEEFRLRNRNGILKVNPGHFYSPIVDPSTVDPYYSRNLARERKDIEAIAIDLPAMIDLLVRFSSFGPPSFPKKATVGKRFYRENGAFPFGDAMALRSMILHSRPKRIIEVGSGNSTACMLDTFEEASLAVELTCIEPHPEAALDRLLRPKDRARVRVLKEKVQNVDLSVFDALEKGDIFFVDSTHVMKTGSDVHFEMFDVLPRLRPGVLVHFHDCQYPFEYPQNWVRKDNWSWNENYALRAFLMYNQAFEIVFWPTMLARYTPDALTDIDPGLVEEVGSGIWLRRRETGRTEEAPTPAA